MAFVTNNGVYPWLSLLKRKGDLRVLNKYLQSKNHPFRSVEITLRTLAGAQYFSKLDANSGFGRSSEVKDAKYWPVSWPSGDATALFIRACVYIYIRQLSSLKAPTLWFIDPTVATCHIQYTFLSLCQFFHEKTPKTRKHSKSAIFMIREWPPTVTRRAKHW